MGESLLNSKWEESSFYSETQFSPKTSLHTPAGVCLVSPAYKGAQPALGCPGIKILGKIYT